MKIKKIEYKIKTATQKEIASHLKKCKEYFLPPLDERVDIEEYANKIYERAITLEAWADDLLIGFIAMYVDHKNHVAFITNVSVMKDFMGFGIAAKLMNSCIDLAQSNNVGRIKLMVNEKSIQAISLYKKFNFVPLRMKDDFLVMELGISKIT